MILYKYTSFEGMMKTVQGGALIVRPMNGYNDPFEFLPVFSQQSVVAYFESLCRSSGFLRRLSQETHILGAPYTAPQLRIRFESDSSYRMKVLDGLLAQSKATPFEFAKDFQDAVSRSFGIISFTSNSSNLLMWSHYADQHRGCVFSVETAPAWRDEMIYAVIYSNSRVGFTGKGPEQENRSIALTKSTDWEYEREYRMIGHVTDDEWRDEAGRMTARMELPAQQLRWICAGIRASDDDVSRLRAALAATAFKDVPVYRASLHPTDFKVVLPDECR